jgi:hypothetical protein
MKRLPLIAAIAILSACAAPQAQVVDVSIFECADPEQRRRLGPGSTYRDLARAHSEAVAGWQDCRSAAEAISIIQSGN